MTYAPTVAYLQAQALEAGAASFWHGKQATQSINYNAPFPQADLLLLNPNLDTASGNVAYDAVVYFYGKDEHENDGTDSVAVLDDIDHLTQRFVQLLVDSEDFDLAPQVRRQPLYREGSMIGTGFALLFTLTARSLVC